MATRVTVFKGRVDPPYDVTLVNGDGSIPDLTGASVVFHLVNISTGQAKVTAAASLLDAPRGKVRYAWQLADVDTVGLYEAWWVVTFLDGSDVYYPDDTADNVEIAIGPGAGYALQGACAPWTTVR